MTLIKPDQIIMSNLIDVYLNYQTLTANLVISGSVLNGNTALFTATVGVGRSNTVADVYARNLNTGKKMSLLAGSIHNPYQAVSTENSPVSVNLTAGVLTIQLSVDNFTGSNITLTTQTWEITVVLSQVPY